MTVALTLEDPVLVTDWQKLISTTLLVIFVCSVIYYLKQREKQTHTNYMNEKNISETLQNIFMPSINGVDFSPCSVESKYQAGAVKEGKIGGDFFDLFKLNDDLLAVVIGDVLGKGIKAGKIAITVSSVLRFCLRETKNPAKCLRKLNNMLCNDPDFSGFVTIFCGIYNCKTNNFTYCTGGHEPPLVYRAETGTIAELHSTGQLIGAMLDTTMENANIQLASNDKLFMFTDGLTEARYTGNNDILNIGGLTDVFINAIKAGEGLDDIFANVQKDAIITDDVAALLINVG
jgi:serine phosphatase RsbU (regulator of sigma subunit)